MYIKNALTMLIIILVLTACQNNSSQDKVRERLDLVWEIEQDFYTIQEDLVELEKEEEQLYEQLIEKDSYDEAIVYELTDTMNGSLKNRHDLMDEQKEIINLVRSQFSEIEQYIDESKSEKEAEITQEMYETMLKRYEVFDNIYNEYKEILTHLDQLYQFIRDGNETNEVLELTTKVNQNYDELFQLNQEFNELTKAFNELKEEYYRLLSS